MKQLFSDIDLLLLRYKNATVLERREMLLNVMRALGELSSQVVDKEQAKSNYQELSYAATLVNYADILHRMENQDYFDILANFYKMELDEELNSWFEFGKNFGQMRLKKPIADYTPEIWEKFRAAQKTHLAKSNNDHFDLDQLDVRNPPEGQLYPIQIQMGGKLHNEAVDRIAVNAQGQIRFAKRHGFYLLPGGGMVEISNEAKIDDLKRKMLEEHLEEEHANLHDKAAKLYDTLTQENFDSALKEALTSTPSRVLSPALQELLGNMAKADETNSTRLKNIIAELDRQIVSEKNSKDEIDADISAQEELLKITKEANGEIAALVDNLQLAKARLANNQTLLKSLAELRATVQVHTFALTPLFQEAFEYIKKNTECVDIRQYLDTRVLGGLQVSHTFIMKGQALEKWFQERFDGVRGEFGDDIAGSDIQRLTLLEALSEFKKVKFSHLLTGLAGYQECLDNGSLLLQDVWDEEQFKKARSVIVKEASAHLQNGAIVAGARVALSLFPQEKVAKKATQFESDEKKDNEMVLPSR